MSRPPRISLENFTYHIITRGNNHQNVFHDEDDFQKYLQLLKRYKEKFLFKLYAYCLMSNHVHLLIEPTQPNTLSKIMQSLTTAHTKLYHYKYKTSGHIWQGRFKNPIIQTDRYLLECMKYIELNPVRANIVKDPSQYKWSTFHFHGEGKKDDLLNEDTVYTSLGETVQERYNLYRNFVYQQTPPQIIERIKESITKGLVLADELFENQIREKLMFSRPKQRGRPKKRINL